MTTDRFQFIILGTGGAYTYHVLKTLINQSCYPLGYIQSGSRPSQKQLKFADIELEVAKPKDKLTELLQTHNIPVFYQKSADMTQLVQQFDADFLVVACWPELIPNDVINAVSIAALNLHPSLLPNYRGSDPIQAQLVVGDLNFGITLHLLDSHFDHGDIVLQNALRLDSSSSKLDIEKLAAKKGAHLFIQAINTYKNPGWVLTKQKVMPIE